MPWYDVTLSFTGYRSFEIEADSEEEAHTKALAENEALSEIDAAEIGGTLQRWPEADSISNHG